MTLRDELNNFYQQNNIPENGGEDHASFEVHFSLFNLTLPNFNWRKKMIHIHDIEHVLNRQDTSWRGEVFIASWEIATGYLRYFPVFIFPLWAMGFGLWKHPHAAMNGFFKGLNDVGVAALYRSKEQLLDTTLKELRRLTENKRTLLSPSQKWSRFLVAVALSQFAFLSPLFVLVFALCLVL
jgi:hypothetical protein